MDLTISSVFTTSLFTSVLILFFCFCFHRDRIVKSVGPDCMIAVLLAALLRMCIPFEFFYTRNINIKDVLTPFRRGLTHLVSIGPLEMSVCHILVVIWGIGAAWGFLHKIYLYRKIIRYVSLLPEQGWDRIFREYGLDADRYEGIEKIKLVYCDGVTSPCLVGLRHPYIILPEIRYDKEQFRYIILHEFMHVHNRDIGWKVVIDLLCTAFWWNPVFWYVKKELFRLIEIRNDMIIAGELSEEEKTAYLVCLKDTALHLAGRDFAFGLSFNRSNFRELKRRMELIAGKTRFRRSRQTALYVLAAVLLFMSSAFIIEPYTFANVDIEGEYTILTPDDMFLIENGEQYEVYVFEEHAMTIGQDWLKYFRGVEIYESLEEMREKRYI